MRCVYTVCRISWEDKTRNSEILSKCQTTGIEAFLIKSQCRWVGLVVRMEENRIQRNMLYGQLPDAPRRVGRPRLRYKDKLKSNLKELKFDLANWEQLTLDRNSWIAVCWKNLDAFETQRITHHNQLVYQAKQRRTQPHQGPWLICEVCGFRSK